MNSKRFEFQHKDIEGLKKDIVFRSIFMFLFIAIFIWQIVMIAIEKNLVFAHIVIAITVLISSLMLTILSFMYVFKDFRIISAIKTNGKCVSSVQILMKTDKKSFIRLYNILIQLLTLATSLILICSITYSILQATYMSTISFYMPLLLLITMSGYNSIYHIKQEIKTQNTVQQFNSTY